MISIAMTSYNGEKYIVKQLESIRVQTIIPDEVIIVDDCSSDNTTKQIKEFIDRYSLNNSWKLMNSDKNRGYIDSFFLAISETSGEIIFLCDHDDIWLPNKIELMSNKMIKYPKILALASKFTKIDSHDNIITTKLNPFSSNSNLIRKRLSNNICTKISIEEVLTYNISPGCTSAFRSEIREDFIKLKKESMQLTHDWKINIIAALRDGLYFLNTTTTYYRIHDNNTLGLHRSMNIKERISVIEKLGCERKLISNIICGFQGMEKVHSKVDINKSKLYAEYIYCLVELRKDALRKLNLLQALKLLMNYKAIKSRYVESIIVDILIIIKEKLK